jgi:hypothetical protein
MHILCHHGHNRSDVYKRIWQHLWFGEKLGKTDSNITSITYVFPTDLSAAVRARFPDSEAGKRDEDYMTLKPGMRDVTWEELQCAQWPNPPKHCSKCGKSKRPGPY